MTSIIRRQTLADLLSRSARRQPKRWRSPAGEVRWSYAEFDAACDRVAPASTGGENVASREVEEAIYLLPQVAEVAVVGMAHPRWVEAVIAVVVLKAGQPGEPLIEPDDVMAHCARHLAPFKAPKRVVFVDSLPKNPSGKLLKRELRLAYADSFASGGASVRPDGKGQHDGF